jgi:excisionase family DNA binding protein
MSPAQAAQLKNVSRRTIMRAIESHELEAFRDNRNHWKIDPQALDKWADAQWAPTGHTHPDLPTLPTPDLMVTLARVEAERDALRELLEQTKEDRDHWRRLAEQQQELLKANKRKGILARILGQS